VNTPAFVDAAELAQVLPVSAYWLKAQARRSDADALPSYKGGKKIVFLEAEALAWFKATCRRPAGPRVPVRRPRRQRRDAGKAKGEHSEVSGAL
jgi:hypothetical protein